MRVCSSCGKSKPTSHFNKDNRPCRTYFAYCKPCQKEYRRQYYLSTFK